MRRRLGDRTRLMVSYLRESTAGGLSTILRAIATLIAATITIRIAVTILIEMRR